ncbi:TrbI/VirB10 family protein [Pseudomonadota bacterium]
MEENKKFLQEEQYEEIQNSNKFLNTKKKQNIFAIIALLILFYAFYSFIGDDNANKTADDLILKNGKNKIVLSDLSSGATAEDMWLQRAEQKIKDLEEKAKEYNELLEKQQERISYLDTTLATYEEDIEKQRQEQVINSAQQEQITQMTQELRALRSKQQNTYGGTVGEGGVAPARTIETIQLNLANKNNTNNSNTYNIKNYLPAGSYAPATVISGVDASTGISAAGDPRPVLFRITGKAITSEYKGKKQKIDLEGCTVTGAASADLSSEKVYVRLLKMTCSRKEGDVTVTEVQGYATAVGKAGIRGPVITRAGNLLMQSFFAGVIGGMGDMYSKALQPTLEIDSGIATEKISANDINKAGLSQGVGNASDRLSQYLIDRAEQYQPVISIPSNIDVELVFHTGVYLDGTSDNTNTGGNTGNNTNTVNTTTSGVNYAAR